MSCCKTEKSVAPNVNLEFGFPRFRILCSIRPLECRIDSFMIIESLTLSVPSAALAPTNISFVFFSPSYTDCRAELLAHLLFIILNELILSIGVFFFTTGEKR